MEPIKINTQIYSTYQVFTTKSKADDVIRNKFGKTGENCFKALFNRIKKFNSKYPKSQHISISVNTSGEITLQSIGWAKSNRSNIPRLPFNEIDQAIKKGNNESKENYVDYDIKSYKNGYKIKMKKLNLEIKNNRNNFIKDEDF